MNTATSGGTCLGLTLPLSLVSNAGYSIEAQYEALLCVYHHVIPKLGPSPGSLNPALKKGDSELSLDGTHIEYSWRWNEPNTKPEIRMVMEPFSRFAGTYMDPLNIKPAAETLYSMTSQVSSLDMTVFNHFISKLYDPAWHKYLETDERPIMTNVCLGFEFLNREILPKAYFFPRKLGQVGLTPIDVWEEALTAAAPQSLTMSTVFSFIKQDSAELGLTLTPLWLGIDVVRPADARLKLCCAEARTSFESVMSVLTMDGRINIEPDLVEQTWGIMKAVCDLPAGFPRSQVPKAPKYNASVDGIDTAGLWGTFFYYFDTGIGREELPDIKFYIPVCHYRADDEAIASATASWMRNHGRDQYVDAYWNTLRAIITHRSLGESRGAHMWLSMMVRGGKLQATSYIAPEGYHLKRLGGRERPQNAIAERVTRDF